MAEDPLNFETEQVLINLVKLMKALRFYPKGHPSLRNAIDESMSAFQPMLAQQDDRAIRVNQGGFYRGEDGIGEDNQALSDLAHLLVERRVHQLVFLPGLPPQELLTLLEGVTTPAEEIYSQGGLTEYLREHRVSSIWLNESSLEEALQKRQDQTEEEPATSVSEKAQANSPSELDRSDLAQQLREIIELLDTELTSDAYRIQANKLVQLSQNYFEQAGLPGILRILPLLLTHSLQENRAVEQRSIAASTFDRLLTDQVAEQLVAQFSKTDLTPQQFQRLQKFIIATGVRIAPFLLTEMGKEKDGTVRKKLTTLLSKMGEPLLDLLRETVHSSKWYVVRNAITLLGDLRLGAGTSILAGLTNHPDQRVRRSLIRSLAMIGGHSAVPLLQKLTDDPVVGLRRPAVKALGATKSAEAILPLLAIAQRFDPFGRQTEIRLDAVAALSTLGDKKAVAPLLALAKRPNILRLKRFEELRAEIILTLVKLGGKNLETELNQWRSSAHGAVQRAAEQSLTILTKRHDDSATD